MLLRALIPAALLLLITPIPSLQFPMRDYCSVGAIPHPDSSLRSVFLLGHSIPYATLFFSDWLFHPTWLSLPTSFQDASHWSLPWYRISLGSTVCDVRLLHRSPYSLLSVAKDKYPLCGLAMTEELLKLKNIMYGRTGMYMPQHPCGGQKSISSINLSFYLKTTSLVPCCRCQAGWSLGFLRSSFCLSHTTTAASFTWVF